MSERVFSDEQVATWVATLPTRALLPRLPAPAFSVLYVPASRFSPATFDKLAALTRRAFAALAPDADALCDVTGVHVDDDERGAWYAAVARRVERAPLDDVRIDFEDGLGHASGDEEDALAANAGRDLAFVDEAALPRSVGLRTKAFDAARAARALSTLERFATGLQRGLGERPAPRLRLTLPKVEHPAEVQLAARAVAQLEDTLGWSRTFELEVMIESPAGLFDARGAVAVPALVEAGAGRVVGLHFGTYDYLGQLGVAASRQRGDHPACTHALLTMLTACPPGIAVSDGASHEIPVGDDAPRALRVHAHRIAHAADLGILCGWDLHPTQLIARWAALFALFRVSLNERQARARGFAERAASRTGGFFDDDASARGLFRSFADGFACGALDEADLAAAGLAPEHALLSALALSN